MNDDKRPYPNDPDLNELLGLGSGDNGSYPHQGAFGGYDETGESPAPDYTDASSYSDSAEPLEEGDVLNSFSEREAYEQRIRWPRRGNRIPGPGPRRKSVGRKPK